MKDLILPKETETSIDISKLDPDFPGLIIGYKDNKPIGYVYYVTNHVLFTRDAYDIGDIIEDGDSLLELITLLIKDNICTNFKILEFY